MDPINSHATAAPTATRSSQVTASSQDGFAEALQQAQQAQPPSAYIPHGGAYSVETHGSHIVNGIQLVPGAPGYRQDLAAPWLAQIAGTDQALAAYMGMPDPIMAALARQAQASDGTATLKKAEAVSGTDTAPALPIATSSAADATAPELHETAPEQTLLAAYEPPPSTTQAANATTAVVNLLLEQLADK